MFQMGLAGAVLRTTAALLALFTVSLAEFRELCLRDKFNAKCPEGHVIVMQSALFGRMRLGHCVKRNFGMIGCSADAIAMVDHECSGRRDCFLDVFKTFRDQHPCSELESYLEVNYTCLKVSNPKVLRCDKKFPTVIGTGTGYISSYDLNRRLSHYGHRFCSYLLEAAPGQKWNLTLYDFGGGLRFNVERDAAKTSRMPMCHKYAIIRDNGVSHSQGQVICGGDMREKNVYLSKKHQVLLDVYDSANEADTRHFVIKYHVVGCADPHLTGVQLIRREGRVAHMRCNASGETWELKCQGSRWVGAPTHTSNCGIEAEWSIWAAMTEDWTTPYGLLLVTGIGIALGVVVGVLLLTVAVACYRRFCFNLKTHFGVSDIVLHRQQRSAQQQLERERQPLQGKKYDVPPLMMQQPPELPNPALYADYSVPGTPRPVHTETIPSNTGPGLLDPSQGYEQNFQIKLRTDDGGFTIIPSENGTETLQLKSRRNPSPLQVEKSLGHKHFSFLDSDDHVYEIPE